MSYPGRVWDWTRFEAFATTEVEETRSAVQTDDDVVRADVAVHDVERLAVLAAYLVRGTWSPMEGTPAMRVVARAGTMCWRRSAVRRMRRARDSPRMYFHHEEKLPVGVHDIDHQDDVRVVDVGRDARLVDEHGDELRVLRELGVEPLDGDQAPQPRRAPSRRAMCTVAIPPEAIGSNRA